MGEDATLLRNYAESGSDRAFSALVDRHFNLVHATALRIVNGDAHLAQDVAQSVFTDFVRKAKSLPRDLFLGGWLYKHTCFVAAKAVRAERRRQTRERQAFEMNSANDEPDPVWSSVGPVLDEAMSWLGTSDRNALVLRFFERKSFRTVGVVLGVSEEAARKRVDRALEKLRGFFAQRGFSFSAAVLSSALDSHAAAAAPAGLASVVASAALVEGAKSSGAGLSLIKIMTITKAKIAVSAVVAGMMTAIVIQSQNNARLEQDNRALRQQTAQMDELRAENERLSQPRPTESPESNQKQYRELMRLRGEIGVFKQKRAHEKTTPAPKVDAVAESTPEDPAEQQRQIAIAKMNYSKQWMLAFIMYSQDNQHICPTNFNQAAPYAPELAGETNLTTDQFKVALSGVPSTKSRIPLKRSFLQKSRGCRCQTEAGSKRMVLPMATSNITKKRIAISPPGRASTSNCRPRASEFLASERDSWFDTDRHFPVEPLMSFQHRAIVFWADAAVSELCAFRVRDDLRFCPRVVMRASSGAHRCFRVSSMLLVKGEKNPPTTSLSFCQAFSLGDAKEKAARWRSSFTGR